MISILTWILVYVFKCKVVQFKDENNTVYTAVIIPPEIIEFKDDGDGKENQPLFT